MLIGPAALRRGLAFLRDISVLAPRALIARVRAGRALPAREVDRYGRRIAFRFRDDRKRFLRLLCNPISIVRYFEFEFVLDAGDWGRVGRALDVSSPRLLPLFLLHRFPDLRMEMVNPAADDLRETRSFVNRLDLAARASFGRHDAVCLPYRDEVFDAVTSVSVLEHIDQDGDSRALREMWRVLEPGGMLVVTVPCAAKSRDEWRPGDAYGLGAAPTDRGFFFQRWYDSATLDARLFAAIGRKPTRIRVFGEKEAGTFEGYERRWMATGLRETALDPLHITRHYQRYPSIDSLPGAGVCGMIFTKPARRSQ